jgi:steroid delta-isomerase-like uncharacterized protein
MGEARDLAVRYFDALTAGDVDGAVALVADDGDFRSPMARIHSKDEIRAFLAGFDSAFPGARFEITHLIESGRSVAVEGVYHGTHTGPLMTPDGGSLPATGRDVSAPFVTIFEVDAGAITSHRPYWDLAGFISQLTG